MDVDEKSPEKMALLDDDNDSGEHIKLYDYLSNQSAQLKHKKMYFNNGECRKLYDRHLSKKAQDLMVSAC